MADGGVESFSWRTVKKHWSQLNYSHTLHRLHCNDENVPGEKVQGTLDCLSGFLNDPVTKDIRRNHGEFTRVNLNCS